MREPRKKTVVVECETDGAAETLYTCPANCRTIIPLMYVSNANGTVSVDIDWYRTDGNHMHILTAKSMGAGEYLQFSDGYIVLEEGDYIEVVATGTTPHLDVLATVEEYFFAIGVTT